MIRFTSLSILCDATARNPTSVIVEWERHHRVDGDLSIYKALFASKTRGILIDLSVRLPEIQ